MSSSESRGTDDLGSRSPGSEEAQRQGESGGRGAEAARSAGAGRQNPQTSERPNSERMQHAAERKHFEPGHAPSEQGEKDHPSPEVIARHQQGAEPRSGNPSAVSGDETQQRAIGGEPRGERTADDGRQRVPGSREQNQG
jgi:hypothetical protein